ncbi:hypothetical protein BC629DRAFT_1598564 [Irpex lacteus]|nr:hypothetical protein BC629DRAFT_1598564 [Irpex lacteus]
MAPKASTSNNTPSAILADAVNAFTKAASLAFAAVEEEAKIEVARAQAEVADMRREHSKNMKFMNKTQLQEKDWERQGEMLKTSLEKSELTIKHQAETIVQLRDEVMQWKSQLETARRELQDWKDQYLRTEQERSRLSSRVDELMAEQLQNATQTARASTWIPEPIEPPTRKQASNTSRKPRPSMPNVPSDDDEEPMPPPRKAKSKPSAAQNGTDRERTYVEPHPPAKEATRDAPAARPKKRPSAVVPRAPPTPRASAPRNDYPDYQAPSPPRPQFIRRVHAIVEVPVKEEMNSDEENALASDDSEWQPSKKAENLRRRRSSIKSKPYVEINEEDDEDEDDQLLIGAEEDPNEIYGTRRVLPEEIRPTPKSLVKNTSGSNKKRKLDADSSNAGRSVAKVVRKK